MVLMMVTMCMMVMHCMMRVVMVQRVMPVMSVVMMMRMSMMVDMVVRMVMGPMTVVYVMRYHTSILSSLIALHAIASIQEPHAPRADLWKHIVTPHLGHFRFCPLAEIL